MCEEVNLKNNGNNIKSIQFKLKKSPKFVG